jgi:cyclophilin family peptidyl-prolyl cis-trans isomerase
MIQGGDPTGTGRGGESIWGKKFNDEIDTSLVFDNEGLLAMANSGPNTNGSQFFITLAPTKWLNGHHTIFGKVITGMDVVKEIGKVAKNQMDRPLKDVIMESVTIEKRESK